MSKVKEKPQQKPLLLQKDDIKLKCHELIINFKKSIELWFLSCEPDYDEIIQNCLDIILHGLETTHKPQTNNNTDLINESPSTPTNAGGYSESDIYSANKIIDDFEWILNAVNIRNNTKTTNTNAESSPHCQQHIVQTSPPTSVLYNQKSFSRQASSQSKETQLKQWLRTNLRQSILCVFLQYLVFEKELLEEHYTSEALLRQEKYVDALFVGLSALETHQYGLLKEIDNLLNKCGFKETKHKRSNSQPNVILPVKRIHVGSENIKATLSPFRRSKVLLAIRKTKSLPEFKSMYKDAKDLTDARPRCKTIAGIKRKHTQPQNIPQSQTLVGNDWQGRERQPARIFIASSGSSSCDDDQLPSTSQNSCSNRNKSPTLSFNLNLTASTTSTSASMCTSVSSSNSNTTTKRIQLINTDDIKIWTDHTWELKNKTPSNTARSTPTQAIPTPHHLSTHKTSKSLSPLNSLFSYLFTTPPSYTSWYTDHSLREENQIPETAIDSINSDNHGHAENTTLTVVKTNPASSLSSTVFDTFLPIYGKKLRSRNSIFDDVNTPMDYSAPVSETTTAKGGLSSPTNSAATVKNSQSLTKFLQMSHLSRNNTELEKENAHFRISEAIISAIEHMKWNKQVPQQRDELSEEATPLATDCLSSAEYKPATITTTTTTTITKDFVEGEEHVPYAEEVCSDFSAEVVGLSLIAKFDEKQLPKVSELKWLVSDGDTPQKLLPMPDLTPTANPDEHVIHSVTRGTKYWAPPRQQIIFTDHPTLNRKELLKKQNFRCAGCGMRVSPQYVQSFRYCTYLGKYNCTGCHRNQISATPAKILQNWDFKCYPVSVFSYRLLEQMSSYPLFYVPDLNPALYCRSKSLLSARNKRMQLKFVKDFIRMCRFALREQMYFESVPDYITSDIDNWSMSDFIDARSNCLHRSIDELIIKCENHIFNCVLCTARGFLCEYCNVDSVIYPWDSRVERCDRCGSCFHRNCWKYMSKLCCRCQRIDKRQEDDGIHDV